MYFTFKAYSEKIKIDRDFDITDLNSILQADTHTIVTGESKNRTIKKPKEELRRYFSTHPCYYQNIPKHPNWPVEEAPEHYTSFKIPKKTGGLRQIDAPDDELKNYLTQLKYYFEDTMHILTHDCAHAYVKGRSTITCMQEHQKNNSRWFLKLDIHGFFPAHTLKYTMEMLKNIYPFGFLLEDENYARDLEEALSYGFLHGILPQGTPLSPTLTNILMTPIDYEIQHKLWKMSNDVCYTRYADDIQISSKYDFNYAPVIVSIKKILSAFHAPFKLNEDKTRYGSSAGRNWNLGIMLNKDNNLTIGHKQNQRFRAMIFNLIQDHLHNVKWSPADRFELQGLISYYKMIEPDYVNEVIKRYEEKYKVSVNRILKAND